MVFDDILIGGDEFGSESMLWTSFPVVHFQSKSGLITVRNPQLRASVNIVMTCTRARKYRYVSSGDEYRDVCIARKCLKTKNLGNSLNAFGGIAPKRVSHD